MLRTILDEVRSLSANKVACPVLFPSDSVDGARIEADRGLADEPGQPCLGWPEIRIAIP